MSSDSKRSLGPNGGLPMTRKPVIRVGADGALKMASTFAYWSDQFWWQCCEHYISLHNMRSANAPRGHE